MPRTRSLFAALATCTAALLSLVATGCDGGEPAGPNRTFDACAPLTLATDPALPAEAAAAVSRGIGLWNDLAHTQVRAVAGADASVEPATAGDAATPAAPPVVPLRFQSAAPPFHGLYDGAAAIVFVNLDLEGDPAALSITVAHEVGHVFGLVHVSPDTRASLMNPGNVTIPPTPADADALAALWGRCGS